MRSRIVRSLAICLGAAMMMGLAFPAGLVSAQTGAFSSDNVEWLGGIPRHNGTAGGILHGDHYYVTDPRGVYIYDVADPTEPELVGSLLVHQMQLHAALAQEEPDTNGEILVVNAVDPENPSSPEQMLVVDVSDATDPHVIGDTDAMAHTWTCVLDCTYAYGREGYIVDLTDPTDPQVAGDWREHVEDDDYMHNFEEVAPGRLIGAGQPSVYLDATDPVNPVELARIDPEFHTLGYHGAIWPNDATDPLMLMQAEIAPEGPTNLAGSDCNDESAYAIATYDATDVREVDERQFGDRDRHGNRRGAKEGFGKQREDAQFHKLEEWRIEGRGAYADGHAPGHTLYCGHWHREHPDWDAGGYLAVAHYDWGTRFLDVSRDGSMEEVGWFQPVGGYTGAAYWITDEIVYMHDYRRGIDILRFTGARD